jgi:hypothetical protein
MTVREAVMRKPREDGAALADRALCEPIPRDHREIGVAVVKRARCVRENSSVATPLRALTRRSRIADVQGPAPTATAAIELRLGAQAPEGVLIFPDGRSRPFAGWIELAAAIEDWRTGALPGADRAEVTNAISGPTKQRERRER